MFLSYFLKQYHSRIKVILPSCLVITNILTFAIVGAYIYENVCQAVVKHLYFYILEDCLFMNIFTHI